LRLRVDNVRGSQQSRLLSALQGLINPADNPGPTPRATFSRRFAAEVQTTSCALFLRRFEASRRDGAPGMMQELMYEKLSRELHRVQGFVMHGRDFASEELVVLDSERDRGVAVIGCRLDTQDPGTAAYSWILPHGDFRRHCERDIDRLSFAQRKIRADKRAAGAQVQSEAVSGLPIAGL